MVRHARALIGVVIIGAWGHFALGGDLNPPAGPVAPTPGPEPRIAVNATNTPGDADSIYKITAAGSYYLTGNLAGVAAKNGIEIDASGVTLDLMGFEVVGVPGSIDGITASAASLTAIEIRNGSVRSWGNEGIDLLTQGASNCRVDGIRAASNARGMYIGNSSIVSNCAARGNFAEGIFLGEQCTLTNCTSSNNGDDGFETTAGTSVIGCTARSNGTNGFRLGGGDNATHCAAMGNTLNGFDLSSGAIVSACTATTNTGHGFYAPFGPNSITGCMAFNNSGDGILVSSDSVVTGNTCDGVGGATTDSGIHVLGSDNRIEGNNCTDCIRGIDVDAPGNIITRNTCAGNTTNWDIVAGNSVGPIVVAGTNAGAYTGGGPFAGTLSTDPNANYSY